ncbi:DUF4373 domain-containing protein [Gracilibacillus sp. YIM 98692]|uniref:DUF4373 domain-containing protein n=1 Tax=Gracilibacillus sp. YIM 98692 TaxID=2663532 RepID=UPI0013D2CC11|nr:DUF4373 domain-containing protein [Gracilibacillus sp. YIM 98692]
MARPMKQGVDYFPLDVHLDDKFKFVEIKFGLKGFSMVIKLMQKIYSQGYWCRWTEDEVLLFAHEARADVEFVEQVVEECLKRNIFDRSKYETFRILTSRGIQKRYKAMVKRGEGVEVIEDYLLMEERVSQEAKSNKNGEETEDMSIEKVNDDINKQSKEKESKGKQSK